MKAKGNEIFAWFRDQQHQIIGDTNVRFAATAVEEETLSEKRPGLMEVLCPQSFPADPKRAAVTRMIVQPDTDAFEQAESAANQGYGIANAARNASPDPRHLSAQAA